MVTLEIEECVYFPERGDFDQQVERGYKGYLWNWIMAKEKRNRVFRFNDWVANPKFVMGC